MLKKLFKNVCVVVSWGGLFAYLNEKNAGSLVINQWLGA